MADNLADTTIIESAAPARRTGMLWRILRLWRMYAALDLAFIAADLKLACIYVFSDAITSIALVTGMLLLAERFAGIGPWSQIQIIFMLGYATTVSGLLNTFFGYNVLMISRRIGRGQLDHTLIQPQPMLVSLLTEGFVPFSGSANLLCGIGLLIWAMAGLALPITTGWIVLLLINIFASVASVLAFSFLWGSLAFWAPRAAEEISSSATQLLDQLKSFPLDGLSPVLLGGLMTVVPVGMVAWSPCRALLGIDAAPYAGWITPFVALLLALFTILIFRKGMHNYERTGSQRYSNLGHRG